MAEKEYIEREALPKRKERGFFPDDIFNAGWNACLDAIASIPPADVMEMQQGNGALPMGVKEKEILLTLIKGLTKRANATPYDKGIKIITGKDVDLLEEVIKKM